MAKKTNKSWHGVIGLGATVSSLREHIDGSLTRQVPMPHVLLAGGSGLGKTHLSSAIAAELGTRMHPIFCSPQTRRFILVKALSELQQGDVLFMDEAHQAPQATIEALFPAIDRNEIPAIEDGKLIEGEWQPLPDWWTLVLATNLPGKLPAAIKTRTPLQYVIQPYDEESLVQIVRNAAAKLDLLLSAQAARRIAQASRGSPRRANHILRSTNVVLGDTERDITRRALTKHLKTLGIDGDNLSEPDRLYLSALARRGGTMSLHDLANQVGLDSQSVQDDVEPFLVSKGLVGVEARGRGLTSEGMRYVAGRGLI